MPEWIQRASGAGASADNSHFARLFSLPANAHYLNCAYMSPLPRSVEEAGVSGLLRKRNPASIARDDFFDDAVQIKRLFAGLVGSPDHVRVAIGPSVSYAVATAARNIPISSGDEIIILHQQFPSNVYSWRRLAAQRRARLVTVSPPAVDAIQPGWNDRIVNAITDRTKIVSLPHVHWTNGTRFDLGAITDRAADVGAAVIIDGTQSIGALPFDLGEFANPPDLVIAAGYKWLLGPYGIALSWFGPRFDDGIPIEENWITRANSREFARVAEYVDGYHSGAARYDVGEHSNFAVLPMMKAALTLVTELGVDRIQSHCSLLKEKLVTEMAGRGSDVGSFEFQSAHLFGLPLPDGIHYERLLSDLSTRRIAVSVRESSVRVSPHVYNDEHDIEALVEAMELAGTRI